MRESGFLNSKEKFTQITKPHDVLQQITHYDLMLDLSAAAGGIYSSLSDKVKYLRVNMYPDLVPSLKKAIERSQLLGLGWDSDPDAAVIWKNGAMTRFGSYLQFDRRSHLGTIVMCNSRCTDSATQLAKVAVGNADTFSEIPSISDAIISKYSGTYLYNELKISAQVLKFGQKSFGFNDNLNGENLESFRLKQYDSSRYLLYSGISLWPDYVEFKINSSTGFKEMHVFSYQGQDSF